MARAIRTAITNGEIAPGHRLLEADLAAQLGTSNGPVREALRQLEAEGFVVKVPYRGAIVAEVSEQEIEEVLIPVRLIIERFAYQRATSILSETDIADLEAVLEKMRIAADSRDDDGLAEGDVEFHELVVQRAAPSHCLQLWRVIEPRVRSYFHSDAPAHKDRHALVSLHEQLLQAIRLGDPDEITSTVESHIRERPVRVTPRGRSAKGSRRSRADG